MFRTEDGGDTWEPVSGFNDHPMYKKWTGGEQDGTPDGPKLHSINVDPRDPRHLYIGMSSGGIFESTDRGDSWAPLNSGVYSPGHGVDFWLVGLIITGIGSLTAAANFIVTTQQDGPAFYIPPARIIAAFGEPAHTYHFETWTIMTWNKNLLREVR